MIKKELVDNLIRTTKKYYKTDEVDILPALREALINAKDQLEQNGKATHHVVDLIEDMAKFTQRSNGTYNDIYRALAVFGIIVEDKEKIK